MPDQTAYATVFLNSPTLGCGQEIEMRLRTTITPHGITGYEISFSSAFGSLIIVRWDGPIGAKHFDVLNMNAGVVAHNGDVIKATIVGTSSPPTSTESRICKRPTRSTAVVLRAWSSTTPRSRMHGRGEGELRFD